MSHRKLGSPPPEPEPESKRVVKSVKAPTAPKPTVTSEPVEVS